MVFLSFCFPQNFSSRSPTAQNAFTSSLEITSAVNMERTIPRASVMANPLTLPLPIAPRTAAAIRVVMLPSTMADIAFSKPILMALLTLLPAAISSRIRAQIITFASTAIPMERMIPAIPGRVSVRSKAFSITSSSPVQIASDKAATTPGRA